MMDGMQLWGLLLMVTWSVWSSSWWLEGTDNRGIRCVTTFHHVCYTLPVPYILKKWYSYIIFLLNWNVSCWSWWWRRMSDMLNLIIFSFCVKLFWFMFERCLCYIFFGYVFWLFVVSVSCFISGAGTLWTMLRKMVKLLVTSSWGTSIR